MAHAPIPDFRFEPSYLKAIAPFLHWKQPWTHQANTHINDSDDEERRERERQRGAVAVRWSGVLWVTIRDQVIMPLLQGVLWYDAVHA
jgi:hypothetical protein